MENRVLGRSIAILHRREQKYMIQTMKEICRKRKILCYLSD